MDNNSKLAEIQNMFNTIDLISNDEYIIDMDSFIIALIFSLNDNKKKGMGNEKILNSILLKRLNFKDFLNKEEYYKMSKKMSHIKNIMSKCNQLSDCNNTLLLSHFKKYLKSKHIAFDDVNIKTILEFHKSLIQEIKNLKLKIRNFLNYLKYIKYFFVAGFAFAIMAIFSGNYDIVLSKVNLFIPTIFFIIPLIKFYIRKFTVLGILDFSKLFNIKETHLEESFLYKHYEIYDKERLNKMINIHNNKKIKNTVLQNESKKQNIANVNSSNKLTLYHLINEPDENVVQCDQYGCFNYFKSIEGKPSLNEDDKKILEHMLDRCLNNKNFTNLIFINLWNLTKKYNGHQLIYSWLSKNVINLNEIISLTINKKNIIILLSKLSYLYDKNKNSTDKIIVSKNKSINNTIDLILNNTNFDNYYHISKELNSTYNNTNNYIII